MSSHNNGNVLLLSWTCPDSGCDIVFFALNYFYGFVISLFFLSNGLCIFHGLSWALSLSIYFICVSLGICLCLGSPRSLAVLFLFLSCSFSLV